MRAVVQRVSRAGVSAGGVECGAIGPGLLILLGVAAGDTDADAAWLAQKALQLRIFNDAGGLMNLDVRQAGGAVLVVSQFTLLASYRKGNRPSFLAAARPEEAVPLYELFVQQCSAILQKPVPTGLFGADMQITLTNDGPVTIILDSRRPA